MDVAEREKIATAPAEELVSLGFAPSADYADALHPGPEWRNRVERLQSEERQRRALLALGELSKEDVAELLRALEGGDE